MGANTAKPFPKKLIIIPLLLVGVGILAYSLIKTFQSGATKSGVVTCLENGECFWTAHIHAFVSITICGEEYRLPIEKGDLTGPHTHEEKNLAHWHDRLSYDAKTKQITNTKPLLLKNFFESIGVPFSNTSIAGKKNGDLCLGEKNANLKAFVNSRHMQDIESYIWRDRDVIQIFFDDRDAKTVENEIKTNPTPFPATGRG